MVGTVVDYSLDSFVKIISGEKVFTICPKEFPKDVRMGMGVEFDSYSCKPLNKYEKEK